MQYPQKPERASEFLELELSTVVSGYVGAEGRSQVLCMSSMLL